MKADGTSVRLISSGFQPVWSPDGRWLAVGTPDPHRIYVMKADGASVRLIGRGLSPAWSPDGEWLAYEGDLNTYSGSVYAVRLDGTKSLRLPHGTDYGWSPDSPLLAYSNDAGLQVVDVTSGESRQVVRNRALGKGGEVVGGEFWSPKGHRIAFEGGTYDGNRIYVAALDGSPPRELIPQCDVDCRRVMWSPDGKLLAYTNYHGHSSVVVVDPASGLAVWKDQSPSNNPYWSPDGNEIVFARRHA
jgi:Tol biopolymer transport system component